MNEKITIIKVGGNIIDDVERLALFLQEFNTINGKKILVHGGGKLATELAKQLQIPQEMVDGRRITSAETLKVVTMVYAGLINKNIVSRLNALGSKSIGITGADGLSILAHKRKHATIDYGFVGDVDAVNNNFLLQLLDQGLSVVVAPITQDEQGQLLNTNADTIAQELAKALAKTENVTLIYSFEKKGVLLDVLDDESVIKRIDKGYYQTLKEKKAIVDGMIPKLDNAFQAIEAGVSKVIIGDALHLHELMEEKSGTVLC
ncbi:MAG: acetylglutamate kinase [Bacteroidota bacterium]